MGKQRVTPASLPAFARGNPGMYRLEVTITAHDHARLERYCAASSRSKRSAIRYAIRRHLEEFEALDG